jgi:hypothetical protein
MDERHAPPFRPIEDRGVHFRTLLKFLEAGDIQIVFDTTIATAMFY